jgi:hypothetical protein
MTYVCPAWEFAMDTYLMKLQRLQSRVLRTTDNFPRCTSIRDMHVAFQFLYVYDFITKLWRQQAQVIQSHGKQMFPLSKAKPGTKSVGA